MTLAGRDRHPIRDADQPRGRIWGCIVKRPRDPDPEFGRRTIAFGGNAAGRAVCPRKRAESDRRRWEVKNAASRENADFRKRTDAGGRPDRNVERVRIATGRDRAGRARFTFGASMIYSRDDTHDHHTIPLSSISHSISHPIISMKTPPGLGRFTECDGIDPATLNVRMIKGKMTVMCFADASATWRPATRNESSARTGN